MAIGPRAHSPHHLSAACSRTAAHITARPHLSLALLLGLGAAAAASRSASSCASASFRARRSASFCALISASRRSLASRSSAATRSFSAISLNFRSSSAGCDSAASRSLAAQPGVLQIPALFSRGLIQLHGASSPIPLLLVLLSAFASRARSSGDLGSSLMTARTPAARATARSRRHCA